MKNVETLLATARENLASAYSMLCTDISVYPTPISGCDAQFNHLLAERSRVHNAIRALEDKIFVPTPRIPNQGDRVESR